MEQVVNIKWTGIIPVLTALIFTGCNVTMLVPPETKNSPLANRESVPEIEVATSTIAAGQTTIPSQEEPRNESTTQVRYDPALEALIEQAKEDLAQRLNIPDDQISLLEANAVVWPDASLGCPQPDIFNQQILHEGVLIVLKVGEREYEYHSGGNQDLFLCELSLKTKKITPNTDKVIPPPIRSTEE